MAKEKPLKQNEVAFPLGKESVSATVASQEIDKDSTYLIRGDTTIHLTSTIIAKIYEYFISQINETAASVLDEAVLSLVRSREFLGIQLDHAKGNIKEKDFKSYIKEYLKDKQRYESEDLMKKIDILYSILSKPLDSEVLSVIFNCEIDQVEEAVRRLLTEYKGDR